MFALKDPHELGSWVNQLHWLSDFIAFKLIHPWLKAMGG
jgi:hypothetical protein